MAATGRPGANEHDPGVVNEITCDKHGPDENKQIANTITKPVPNFHEVGATTTDVMPNAITRPHQP